MTEDPRKNKDPRREPQHEGGQHGLHYEPPRFETIGVQKVWVSGGLSLRLLEPDGSLSPSDPGDPRLTISDADRLFGNWPPFGLAVLLMEADRGGVADFDLPPRPSLLEAAARAESAGFKLDVETVEEILNVRPDIGAIGRIDRTKAANRAWAIWQVAEIFATEKIKFVIDYKDWEASRAQSPEIEGGTIMPSFSFDPSLASMSPSAAYIIGRIIAWIEGRVTETEYDATVQQKADTARRSPEAERQRQIYRDEGAALKRARIEFSVSIAKEKTGLRGERLVTTISRKMMEEPDLKERNGSYPRPSTIRSYLAEARKTGRLPK